MPNPADHLDRIVICPHCWWTLAAHWTWVPEAPLSKRCYRHEQPIPTRPLSDGEKALVLLCGLGGLIQHLRDGQAQQLQRKS